MNVSAVPYAELGVTSNFSFLRGGAHPHELVETADALGLAAIAIADRNTLAGVVRAHVAARDRGIRLVVGARLVTLDGFEALCFPADRQAYGRLSKLLTAGNRRAPKGECHLGLDDFAMLGEGHHLVAMPPYAPGGAFVADLERLSATFPGHVSLAVSPYYRGNDRARLQRLDALAANCRTPLIATNDVLYHVPARRPLQDLLTCIREHCTIDEAGFRLEKNAERHVKDGAEMARLLPGHESAIARALEVAQACRFSLDELAYEYPDEPAGKSATPQQELERLTWQGARERFPQGLDDRHAAMIAHELKLIGELDFAAYFLTVHDIVRFARSREQPILCQGRGSAANSIVCYCLGVTSVNPAEIDLLFERFISAERGEPPDIDVDFEHERREEVIQYIYGKYGRHRAGLAATVISYRSRSAIREAGKAMGLSPDVVGALAGMIWGFSNEGPARQRVVEAGLDPDDPRLRQTMKLAGQLIGFPRHLSQHVGGFVITRGALDEVVPIANAAMADRTMVEWDKDDLDALKILKVDVLSLGMLTCLRKSFDLLEAHYGEKRTLATVPRGDKATYAMIQRADTVGVFQIESRAQMSMLPRLKPASFYDLVIEIAIVRPGPIQGDMVHPYLRRRQGLEHVEYPSAELEAVLRKTLGVPLFQEQAMKIAIVGAGFSPAKADRLRRAMATFKRNGDIGTFREEFIAGMRARGYTPDFAERCFKQIEGFSDYGFPESHSASFALLAYASSWLKCHYPDVFACALLNSQPMGFYSASSIVRDFREHGGEVRPVDVNFSHWDHTLETVSAGISVPASAHGPALAQPAQACPATQGEMPRLSLRLGLRQVQGMREDAARQIIAARAAGRFASPRDLHARARADAGTLERLANADAFRSVGLDRRAALWEVRGLDGGAGAVKGRRPAAGDLPLFAGAEAPPHGAAAGMAEEDGDGYRPLQAEPRIDLPALLPGEQVVEDYDTLRLSLKAHPVSFLRERLASRRVLQASSLDQKPDGAWARIAGLVLVRQRPGTASGVIFITLEDETGIANVIVWPKVFEKHRRIVMGARMVMIEGQLQKEQGVIHLVARRLTDLTGELMDMMTGAAAQAGALQEPSQWRHPRNTRVLPKGRNFQ
ncbi:MAG: error-prone DNA polymerase [Pseudomonadota bacterium]|nr:error-prone DNA polymerase [Pseudomonadota bacterium]